MKHILLRGKSLFAATGRLPYHPHAYASSRRNPPQPPSALSRASVEVLSRPLTDRSSTTITRVGSPGAW